MKPWKTFLSQVSFRLLHEKPTAAGAEPNHENVKSGKYPIWRPLYVYAGRKPGKPMDALTGEFLKFVLSKEGQEIVIKDGFYPMSAEQAAQQLSLLE